MEELTLTTPSILFSAISLIMLAYTQPLSRLCLGHPQSEKGAREQPLADHAAANGQPAAQAAHDPLDADLRRQQPVAVRSMHATDIHRLAENGRLYVRRGAGSAGRLAVDLDPRTADLGPRARSAPRPCGRKRGSKDRTGPNVPGTEAARKSAPARNRKLGPPLSKATAANHSTGGTSINSTRASLNARSEKSDMRVTPSPSRQPRVVPAISTLPSTTNT